MYAWIEELRFPRRRTTRPSLKQAKKWCLQLRLIVLTSTRLRTICLAGVYRFVVDENLSLAGSKRGPIRTLLASWDTSRNLYDYVSRGSAASINYSTQSRLGIIRVSWLKNVCTALINTCYFVEEPLRMGICHSTVFHTYTWWKAFRIFQQSQLVTRVHKFREFPTRDWLTWNTPIYPVVDINT